MIAALLLASLGAAPVAPDQNEVRLAPATDSAALAVLSSALVAAVPHPQEVAQAVVAQAPRASPVLRPPGAFLGEELRFQNAGLVRRVFSDFAAIPMNLPRWDLGDWAWFGGTAAVTIALFLPLDAPLDQRFQNFLGENAFVPGVWTPENDLYIFGGLLGLALGSLGYGYFSGRSEYVETFSLLAEALAITQALHIGSKLLLSRDGPNNGNGRTIHGPDFGTFERFPEGAPSGHTATLFALATVLHLYWDQPFLTAIVYSAAAAFAAAIVLDRYHYISDVLWGGSMGVAVGRYVALHRSSRFQYVDGLPVRKRKVSVTPMVIPTPDGATGGAVLQGDF